VLVVGALPDAHVVDEEVRRQRLAEALRDAAAARPEAPPRVAAVETVAPAAARARGKTPGRGHGSIQYNILRLARDLPRGAKAMAAVSIAAGLARAHTQEQQDTRGATRGATRGQARLTMDPLTLSARDLPVMP